MNRMKRWLLLIAAVVVILPNVQAVKATALIFGRTPASATSSSSTTSTTIEPSDDNEEVPASDQVDVDEVTKPPLTGIPQIDYVWDPNLPRELNGFNLSSYPFLSLVPDAEDIDFRCDGLHDGFYASIKFGCQLYHHCIYGIRHDFLCANFTAFDQKTFICHFVSEVNCKNSAKYWFRNDALYQATTTTTTTTSTIAPPPTTTERRRPAGRKPLRRRRPQNDYYYEDEEYDDDYVVEERINRRRKPNVRNRYRPVYDDDYPENDRGYEGDEAPAEDDYEYEPRTSTQSRNRNRPTNNRRYRNRERNNRRNLNEQRSSTRVQDDEPRSIVDVKQPEPTRRYNRDRRPMQDDRERVRERDRNRYVTNNNKRPLKNDDEEVDIEYEPEEEELPRRNNFRNTQSEKRSKGRTNPTVNRDDFEDTPPPRRKNTREEIREEETPIVRPSSNGASVFNRPRVAPKISRPVPLNEKQKYDYKKTDSPSVPSNKDEEYYDEYEDELPPQKGASKTEVRPQAQHQSKTIVAPPNRNTRPSAKDEALKEEAIEEEYDEDEDVIETEDVKPISKTDAQQSRNAGAVHDIATQSRNKNDNNDRSSGPTGPSIFQTGQQQKLREKFRNNFRSQSRQPTVDAAKEAVHVLPDDKPRNNQKQITEQQNLRGKFRNNYRSNIKELRPSAIVEAPTATDEDIDYTSRDVSQKSSSHPEYKPSRSRLPPTGKDLSPQADIEPPLIDETPRREQNHKNRQSPPTGTDSSNEDVEIRPAVRVVKRPFLPSRGGNPYLPRGLRPVGSSEEEETYSNASSKEQLNDHPRQSEETVPQQPSRNTNYDQRQHFPGPLTTQPPQVDPPKDPLDHIYSEYDVTLNDALNPTLKPLVTSRGSPIGFSKYEQEQYSYVPLNTATAQSRSSVVQHANHVRKAAEEYLVRRQARNKSMTKSMTTGLAGPILAIGNIHFLPAAKSGTFFARDNVSNFISWCRKSLQIFECLLFETDDLIMRKNEKHVILCLLEVARRGAKFGMLAPMLVQMERQIDREIAADNRANGVGCGTQTENGSNTTSTGTDLFESDTDDEDDQNEAVLMYGPQPQIITNDLKSLDEMVRDLVEKCTCPSQFPMVRVSEGKYRIGDTKVLIFVRILRSHVMVRVGGGWDTLSHYLDKHDPCRCRASHRSSVAARLITRTNQTTNGIELHKAQVFYERSPPVTRKLNNTTPGNTTNALAATLSPPSRARSRSRSPSAQRKQNTNNGHSAGETLQLHDKQQLTSPNLARRSMSPSPRRLNEFKKKQTSLDSAVYPATVVSPTDVTANNTDTSNTESKTEQTNGDGKFENISDNGSEISDEGYRSLGVIQANLNGNLKRSSLHSQTSEEPEQNGRHEQTSSDSQLTPTDELISVKTDAIESNSDTFDGSQQQQDQQPSPPKTFEQSGVFITDDDITIDISTTTGLRKTGFSANLYGDDGTPKPLTKIPRSPMLVRRKSDLCSEIVTGLPVNSMRKSPVYRSVRKPTVTKEVTPVTPPQSKITSPKNINTWNGRSTNKNRPALGNDTFQTPTQNSSFTRNSSTRTSQNLYDKNGRRIKSTNSSPTKTTTSPLAQQILEAAGNAKNDSQMLEKMKALLSKYTKVNGNGKDYDEDDFTTAWVNSNGTLDRATTNCSPSPTKMQSKRSSAASSIDSNHSKETSVSILTSRRDRGVSRIPAPIRQNTELY